MGSELQKFEPAQYPALVKEHRDAIMLAVRENLGGAEIRPMDLDRVSVPAGGGLYWMVKSLDHPDGAPVKELTGIIVFQRRGRSYWKQGLGEGGGGTPPDCSSEDAIYGVGDPGGACEACHLAQFGSSAKGKGQACSEKRMLFLLRPGAALPTVVMIPPSSLKNLKPFMLRLASEGVPYFAVEVAIGLEKAKNQDGIEYGAVTFNMRSKISGDQLQQIIGLAADMKEVFTKVPVHEDEKVAI